MNKITIRRYTTWNKRLVKVYDYLALRSRPIESYVTTGTSGACVAYMNKKPVGIFAYDYPEGPESFLNAEGTYLQCKARGQGIGVSMWLRVLKHHRGKVYVYCSSCEGLALVRSVASRVPRIHFTVTCAVDYTNPAKVVERLRELENVVVDYSP